MQVLKTLLYAEFRLVMTRKVLRPIVIDGARYTDRISWHLRAKQMEVVWAMIPCNLGGIHTELRQNGCVMHPLTKEEFDPADHHFGDPDLTPLWYTIVSSAGVAARTRILSRKSGNQWGPIQIVDETEPDPKRQRVDDVDLDAMACGESIDDIGVEGEWTNSMEEFFGYVLFSDCSI